MTSRTGSRSYEDRNDYEDHRRYDHDDPKKYDDNHHDGMITKSTIRVIAPATLQEGYSFDVLVDGNPHSVQVPPGGIKEGQEFEVPYEIDDDGLDGFSGDNRGYNSDEDRDEEETRLYNDDDETYKDDMTQPVQTMSNEDDLEEGNQAKDVDNADAIWYDETTGAPIGRWRTGLCSCCDVITQSTFWMGVCCTPVLIAQLITRLGLTWNGLEGPQEETSLSFNRILLGMMIVLAVWKIPIVGGIGLLVFFLVIVVYVGSYVRAYVRHKYKIPAILPSYCGGERCDDVCCMFWCGCCSSIQIARHTHDDKEYPGHGCTTTGLEFDAPKI